MSGCDPRQSAIPCRDTARSYHVPACGRAACWPPKQSVCVSLAERLVRWCHAVGLTARRRAQALQETALPFGLLDLMLTPVVKACTRGKDAVVILSCLHVAQGTFRACRHGMGPPDTLTKQGWSSTLP